LYVVVTVCKPDRRIQFRRVSPRCEDNIQMDLREMACEGVDWIYVTHDRDQWLGVVNMIMNVSVV
jgi:hypothetical protein